MSILQLLFTGSNLNATGAGSCSSVAHLPDSQLDELFPVTGDTAVNRNNAGEALSVSEAALYELFAMLPDGILQNGEFSIPPQETGLPDSFLDFEKEIPAFNSWLNADSSFDGTVLWNYQPKESVAVKTADIYNFPALTGRFMLNQEQTQQLLQFLNRDDLQQALKHWQQNMLPAEKPTTAGNIANGTTQPLQVLNQDGIQQTTELLRQNTLPAEKPTAAGNIANGTTQPLQVLNQDGIQQTTELLRQNTLPAEKPTAAMNAVDPPAEQLSVLLRDMMKSQVEKTPHSVLQTQPVSGKVETGSGTNVNYAEPNEATTAATAGQSNVTGPSSAKAVFEMPNNALRADQTQITANVVDSTATVAKSMGGETPPAVRSEQPLLFMQLAEAIRGQIARDGHGRTHVRLQLQPESLGEVVIKLVYKDGNVSTHFHAATESVRQVIESSLGQLREALTAHNLNLQQSTVTAGDDQGRWAQEPNREHRFNSPYRQSGDGRGEKEETASESFTEPPKTANRYRVNHFV